MAQFRPNKKPRSLAAAGASNAKKYHNSETMTGLMKAMRHANIQDSEAAGIRDYGFAFSGCFGGNVKRYFAVRLGRLQKV
jgi:hypothetical protein